MAEKIQVNDLKIENEIEESRENLLRNSSIEEKVDEDVDDSVSQPPSCPVRLNLSEENFECFGQSQGNLYTSGSEHLSVEYSRDENDSFTDVDNPHSHNDSLSRGSFSGRNSWLRTSLRRSPKSSNQGENMLPNRRWGSFRQTSGAKRPAITSSNALASQLYRSSSCHSSGRSSAGEAEEINSEGSLEDEVIVLSRKVHYLEEKFTALEENQSDVDDRYNRSKQENVELKTKLFMLEEQLRDVEYQSDQKLKEEQKKRENLSRLEREKHSQLEIWEIKWQNLLKEISNNKLETERIRQQCDRERLDKNRAMEKKIQTLEDEIFSLREINDHLKEQERQKITSTLSHEAMKEFKLEFENFRKTQLELTDTSKPQEVNHQKFNPHDHSDELIDLKSLLKDYEQEIKRLKQSNTELQETNEDLTAQLLNQGLEEGRNLLAMNATVNNSINKNNGLESSLADEFEAMSQNNGDFESDDDAKKNNQLKQALKEQKEVNEQLRRYIDGILLNIVENYPQLLEVKNRSK